MGVLGASMRLGAGGRGHRTHQGGRRSRVFEKIGDLSEPLLFVFRQLRDV